ncbi:MAG: hypothetical protein J2P25_00880 [Nocardiopsaceae bacterium]|nr:hypothetical protein [Nocardiopsaceae bacterium]
MSGSVNPPGKVTRSIHAFSVAGTERLYIGAPMRIVPAARTSLIRGRVIAHCRSSASVSASAATLSSGTGPSCRSTRRPRAQKAVSGGGTGSTARSR